MRYLFILGLLAVPTSASAQSAVSVTNAPIYVAAQETQSPLRTAAVGTTLRVVADQGEGLQVVSNDPQLGLRYGLIKRTYFRVADPTTQPMDLSATPAPSDPAEAGASAAQTRPPEAEPFYTNHIVGRAGGTFGTTAAALVGVELSGEVDRPCQVYASFDWHFNTTPTYFKTLEDAASSVAGVPVTVKVPVFAAMGGVKLIAPRHMGVRPYGLGGFGFGHGMLAIKAAGDDITDAVAEAAGLDKTTYTRPIYEVGGGVAVPIGQFYIDASYRFRHVFHVKDVNMSGVYVGAGFSY